MCAPVDRGFVNHFNGLAELSARQCAPEAGVSATATGSNPRDGWWARRDSNPRQHRYEQENPCQQCPASSRWRHQVAAGCSTKWGRWEHFCVRPGNGDRYRASLSIMRRLEAAFTAYRAGIPPHVESRPMPSRSGSRRKSPPIPSGIQPRPMPLLKACRSERSPG